MELCPAEELLDLCMLELEGHKTLQHEMLLTKMHALINVLKEILQTQLMAPLLPLAFHLE